MPESLRIVGIDPGLRRTGWGIIDIAGSDLRFVAAGTVAPPTAASLAERLRVLHDGLQAVLRLHAPIEAAVEETFVSKNASSTLKLGHARGVAVLVPALAGLPVSEYAPNVIKKSVVGAGHAEKAQIRLMVERLLPRAVFDSEDSADALAVAITHAHRRKLRELGV